jgi:hypothetical protein
MKITESSFTEYLERIVTQTHSDTAVSSSEVCCHALHSSESAPIVQRILWLRNQDQLKGR